jgi:hypothetical protein
MISAYEFLLPVLCLLLSDFAELNSIDLKFSLLFAISLVQANTSRRRRSEKSRADGLTIKRYNISKAIFIDS